MRDVERIDRILDKVRGVWVAHPDWRLGQLIENAIAMAVQADGHPADSFYVEDHDLEGGLDRL